jgi:radical SAM protein with 4Fe4S-binding SPASM domain
MQTLAKTKFENLLGLFMSKEKIDKIAEDYTVKPQMMNLEVINICNARCIFCGYPKLKRTKGIMPMEITEKALNDYCDIGGGNLGLFPVVGEPLLDPYLLERIKMARKRKEIKRIAFFTNGLLLDKVGIKEILTSGVSVIAISSPGFDELSYKLVYKIDDYERVFNNVYNLLKTNKQLDNIVKITICIRSYKTIREIQKSDDFKKVAELADEFDYQSYYDHWDGRVEQDDLLPTMRIRKLKLKKEPCRVLYWHAHILHNGDVTGCGCRDMDGKMILGNIMDDSLYNIWHSNKLKRIKENFYNGKFHPICKDCREYRGFKNWMRLSRTRELSEENKKAFQESRFFKRGEGKSGGNIF